MTAGLRVFVNERPYELPPGSVVRDALRAAVPDLLPAAESGAALITDARGLPAELDAPLAAGAILRAQRSSRRSADTTGADAGS